MVLRFLLLRCSAEWREEIEAKAGLVVNCNAQGLSNALLALIERTLLGKEMGQQGHRLVEERFTWEVVDEQIIQMYPQIMSEQGLLTKESQPGNWRLA